PRVTGGIVSGLSCIWEVECHLPIAGDQGHLLNPFLIALRLQLSLYRSKSSDSYQNSRTSLLLFAKVALWNPILLLCPSRTTHGSRHLSTQTSVQQRLNRWKRNWSVPPFCQ